MRQRVAWILVLIVDMGFFAWGFNAVFGLVTSAIAVTAFRRSDVWAW